MPCRSSPATASTSATPAFLRRFWAPGQRSALLACRLGKGTSSHAVRRYIRSSSGVGARSSDVGADRFGELFLGDVRHCESFYWRPPSVGGLFCSPCVRSLGPGSPRGGKAQGQEVTAAGTRRLLRAQEMVPQRVPGVGFPQLARSFPFCQLGRGRSGLLAAEACQVAFVRFRGSWGRRNGPRRRR